MHWPFPHRVITWRGHSQDFDGKDLGKSPKSRVGYKVMPSLYNADGQSEAVGSLARMGCGDWGVYTILFFHPWQGRNLGSVIIFFFFLPCYNIQ